MLVPSLDADAVKSMTRTLTKALRAFNPSLPVAEVVEGAYTNTRKCTEISDALNEMVESNFECV